MCIILCLPLCLPVHSCDFMSVALFEAIEAEDEGRCQSLLDSQDGIPPDLNR